MNNDGFELLCIGNALVDIYANVNKGFCLRNGLNQPVQHIEMERLKKIIADCSSESLAPLKYSAGGGAANAAKSAALCGAKVYFTGAIGSSREGGGEGSGDQLGRFFEEQLRAAGVQLQLPLKTAPTGACLYLTEAGGERCIAASPSAALELSPADISAEDAGKAKLLVIDGFMMNRPVLQHILELGAGHGIPAAIDLSSTYIAKEYAAQILDYTRRYSLILFMNEEEASAFYNAASFYNAATQQIKREERKEEREKEELQEISSFFQSLTDKKPFPVAVITRAHLGAVCYAAGSVYTAETKALSPLDSTGAGDVFCGAFLSAWVRGKSIQECAVEGNKMAGLFLMRSG